MAKGADTDEFVVLSKVRTGLKREFAFALKARNEIAGCLGRTRSRKRCNEGFAEVEGVKKLSGMGRGSREADSMDVKMVVNGRGADRSGGDRSKDNGKLRRSRLVVEKTVSEEEPKSDVVDFMSDDDNRSQFGESKRKEGNSDAMMTGSEDEQKDYPVAEDGLKEDNAAGNVGEVENQEDKAGQSFQGFDCGIVESSGKRFADNAEGVGRSPKRFTPSALKPQVEETEDSGTCDAAQGEIVEQGNGDIDTPCTNGARTSMKVTMKTSPTKLRELLQTGLLEGLSVRYIRGTRAPKDLGLHGVIKGSGILCFCVACRGIEVVSPNQFELHAGSANKRPPDYIYLESGNTLRDVLNACKNSNLDSLEATIRNAIGCLSERVSTFCINCKASIAETGAGRTMLLCDSCLELKVTVATPRQITNFSNRSAEANLAQNSSEDALKSSRIATKIQGRLTRKDLRLHKLVFQEDVLPDGTEVGYYARGKKLLSGYKMGSGIFCTCCQKEVSPSQFESHAGWASRRKPYLHIYTSNGVSLHELSVSLSKSRKFPTEENDDLCSICFDLGDLLCCDGCPRAFHIECIPLRSVPQGTWYCRYCENSFQREKFAEHNANAIAAGRVAGIDPIEQITSRCIRIVKNLDAPGGVCVLCSAQDFSRSGFGPRTVIICDQCEKEYHVGCLRSNKIQDLKALPDGNWFCSTDCGRIHSALQQVVEHGEQQLPQSLLDVMKKKQLENGSESEVLDIKWRLLAGKFSCSDDIRIMLSKAVSIFHERFDPIINPTSNQDLIPHMVYGRNTKDRDLGGMYCAILSVNSTVVSAGVFRVFGEEMAELPIVATSSDSQGKGYFQSLYSCIENLLKDLGVKNLLLPAAEEAQSLWTNKFGYVVMPPDQLYGFKRLYSMMTFDGTAMLHKLVPK